MKKIGFFGGCFSPPSNVHINLAKELVENKLVDNVVFIPVGDYYKKQNLIKAEYRYNMLLLACKGYEYLKVDNITLNSKKTLYAIDTFKLIYEKYLIEMQKGTNIKNIIEEIAQKYNISDKECLNILIDYTQKYI